MNTSNFQKLLFKYMVTAIAVDGEIHEDELLEIRDIVRQTPYFLDFDHENVLEENLDFVRTNGKEAVNQCLDEISTAGLSEKQKFNLVEMLLRVLDADRKFEPNEIKYLHLTISRLELDEEVLMFKFPGYMQHLVGFDQHLGTKFDLDFTVS